MTAKLTTQTLQGNQNPNGVSSTLAKQFYDVSFRRDDESMEQRNERALTYFASLSEQEQEYLEGVEELKSTFRCLRGEGF